MTPPGTKEYRDPERLRELYHERELTLKEAGEELGVAGATVGRWMRRHGIDRRHSTGEYEVPFQFHANGAPAWRTYVDGEDKTVYVHRLVAVAKYGIEAVKDNHVHHVNDHRADNRPENLEVMSESDHFSLHASEEVKFDWYDRIRIAEMYENTDRSSRDLADVFDCSMATILRIHRELTEDTEECEVR